jgi:hypothetical protein
MKRLRPDDRLCLLTDSLPSAIRWRLCDYEAMLKEELRILAAQESRLLRAHPPRHLPKRATGHGAGARG